MSKEESGDTNKKTRGDWGCAKTEEEEGPSTEEGSRSFHGSGVCKWFNVRMGFGFLSMTNREGTPLEAPVDVFVHQVSASQLLRGGPASGM
ncbi:hypothetical protein MATL_G00125240 [Megalops atlanticus]|uniref:CSD domain-containing protein n=1 Tax=Megalops atlanticus TaxID=7932 RepID=A0A9D3PZN4_MEGAT|nr:hypothetical protein MATL_G00125240 [Megalops atlanticus]